MEKASLWYLNKKKKLNEYALFHRNKTAFKLFKSDVAIVVMSIYHTNYKKIFDFICNNHNIYIVYILIICNDYYFKYLFYVIIKNK